jgi:hypothetical protein
MFDFGRTNKVVTREGFEYFSDVALHIQCGWQIASDSSVLVASGDSLFRVTDEPGHVVLDDDATLLTHRFRQINKGPPSNLVVAGARIHSYQRLEVAFQNGYVLDVLPLTSTTKEDVEFWRLIETAGDGLHIVAQADGMWLSPPANIADLEE